MGEFPNCVIALVSFRKYTVRHNLDFILIEDHSWLFRRKPYTGVLELVAILTTNVAVLCLTRIYALKEQEKLGESDF